MNDALERLQKNLGYRFKDASLLETAATHSSYAHEKGDGAVCNERLEFLGDAVLGFVSAKYFYENLDAPEGELSRRRAAKVCEKALCSFARELEIGPALLLGKGETRTGGRERPSILSDAFEAVLAAVFLDGGLEEASKIVLRFISRHDALEKALDYKTVLQEIVQQNRGELLEYVLTGKSGPDHAKVFTVEARLDGNVVGVGSGASKKLAEQRAAKGALELMGIK